MFAIVVYAPKYLLPKIFVIFINNSHSQLTHSNDLDESSIRFSGCYCLAIGDSVSLYIDIIYISLKNSSTFS